MHVVNSNVTIIPGSDPDRVWRTGVDLLYQRNKLAE